MVSSISKTYDLTIANASSAPYTLKVMTIVALIFTPLVLVYQGWSYWVFRARVRRPRQSVRCRHHGGRGARRRASKAGSPDPVRTKHRPRCPFPETGERTRGLINPRLARRVAITRRYLAIAVAVGHRIDGLRGHAGHPARPHHPTRRGRARWPAPGRTPHRGTRRRLRRSVAAGMAGGAGGAPHLGPGHLNTSPAAARSGPSPAARRGWRANAPGNSRRPPRKALTRSIPTSPGTSPPRCSPVSPPSSSWPGSDGPTGRRSSFLPSPSRSSPSS